MVVKNPFSGSVRVADPSSLDLSDIFQPTNLDPSHVPYRRAAAYVRDQLHLHNLPPPTIGIICGSGLSSLSDALDSSSPTLTISYEDVPFFPSHCTVVGHSGEMVLGTLRSIPTLCFRGRFHSYEGHSMQTVVMPVQLMRCLGVRLVIVTNAAGGLKEEFKVGDLAIIRDHIALPLLCGKNPLVGPNDDELGPRFPPTSNLYDKGLQDIVVEAAKELGFGEFLHTDSTYAFVSGPQYESKSECTMLRLLGADAVGMSTVPEILAAHHAGMAVLCLSLITNKVVYYDDPDGESKHANHEEVLSAVKARAVQLVTLVEKVVEKCGESYLPDLEPLPEIMLETEGRVKGEVKQKKGCCGVPMHCLVMGGAILALGAVVGATLAKRR